MNKWIAEFELEDGDTMPEDMDLNYMGARIALHCRPMWIPVSERMPEEENKSYWICTDCGYQCECRWTNVNPFWTDLTTDWHWHHMDVPSHQRVVAWMPLPEPYKTEGEE